MTTGRVERATFRVSLPARYWARAARLFRVLLRKPLGFVGLILVLTVFLVGVLAPYIAPYDPTSVAIDSRLEGPSLAHPVGTNALGQDVLTRLMYGARISLFVSFVSVGTAVLIGGVLGALSGYFRGPFDFVLQRVMDLWMAYPLLLLALAIVALLGASTRNVIFGIAIVLIPNFNRMARASTLSVVNLAYIEAARALGAGDARILARHVLPNITAPLIVMMTASFGSAILAETSLTFLGVGASPTEPTWGSSLSMEGRAYWEQAPWLAIAPGVAISIAVLGYNLFGDALRDIWDPALRGQ